MMEGEIKKENKRKKKKKKLGIYLYMYKCERNDGKRESFVHYRF